jgi:hypothetical protein
MPRKDAKRPHEGVLKDLPRSTQVTVLAQQGAWLNVKVTLENKTLTGYVSQELVRFVSQSKTEKPKPATNQVEVSKLSKALLDARQYTNVAARDNTSVKFRQNLKKSSREEMARESRNEILDGLQTVLDLVGFIPGLGEVADLTNAGISAMRGNYLEAALSLISVIPGVGDAIGKGAKYALKFADAGVARKALAAMRNVDLTGFFNKLARHPQLVKYVESLRQAVVKLEQELLRIAGIPTPQFAIPGGGYVPSGPLQNNVVQMSGNVTRGYKRGDHVFNNGLTKLGLEIPTNSLLEAAFRKFQGGLKKIEVKGGFNLVANKGAHAADLNSTLFGERLTDLRNAWGQLNRVLGNPNANIQHRAAAVNWAMDALKKLRQASFDKDAVLAGVREMNARDAKAFKEKVDGTATLLDNVFDGLVKDLEKLMPPSGAVGLSMGGPRGRATSKKKR